MIYPAEEVLGISPFVHLRREKDKVVIAHLPHLSLNYGVMSPHHAAIFSLIDGHRTVKEIAEAVSILTDMPLEKSMEYFHKILDYVTPGGRALVRNAQGKKVIRFDPFDFIIPADSLNLRSRLEAPVTVMLQITHKCEANCLYCYACRRNIPQGNMLTTRRWLEILDEMAELGIWQVNFCGGDPVCHKEFLKILERALDLSMIVDISTKAYIDKFTAQRMDQMGLDYIQVSIEAADSETGDFIFGRKGHYSRVIKTLENLLETSIFVRTNSIIVKQNLHDLDAIIQRLMGLGVKEMKFAPAFRSMHIDNTSYILDSQEISLFERQMESFSQQYREKGLTVIHSVMPDPTRMSEEARKKYWFEERAICSAGRCSMIVTPDGKVSICEEAPQYGELIVGNVTAKKLQEVWNSRDMIELAYPDKERFKGSACYSCQHFDSCVIGKGHCFKDALKGYGEPFTVNPFCPSATNPLPRLY